MPADIGNDDRIRTAALAILDRLKGAEGLPPAAFRTELYRAMTAVFDDLEAQHGNEEAGALATRIVRLLASSLEEARRDRA